MPHLSLKELFDQTFGFDPALAAQDVETTVPQALFLMNNPMLQANIQATGETLLASILKEYPDNKAAVSRCTFAPRSSAHRPASSRPAWSTSRKSATGARPSRISSGFW